MVCVSVAQLPFPGDLLCRLSWWAAMQDNSPRCSIVQTQSGDFLNFTADLDDRIAIAVRSHTFCLIARKIALLRSYMVRQLGLWRLRNLGLTVV